MRPATPPVETVRWLIVTSLTPSRVSPGLVEPVLSPSICGALVPPVMVSPEVRTTTFSAVRGGLVPSSFPSTRTVSPGTAASTPCCRLQNGAAWVPVPVSVAQVLRVRT